MIQKYILLSSSAIHGTAPADLAPANKRIHTAYLLKESLRAAVGLHQRGLRWLKNLSRTVARNCEVASPENPTRTFTALIQRHWDGLAAYCKPENETLPRLRVEGVKAKSACCSAEPMAYADEQHLRLKILTCMLPKL